MGSNGELEDRSRETSAGHSMTSFDCEPDGGGTNCNKTQVADGDC
jgi:hypothetical protein